MAQDKQNPFDGDIEEISSFELAFICNDLPNAHLYHLDGIDAYKGEELIGQACMKQRYDQDSKMIVTDYLFKPSQAVKYISVTLQLNDQDEEH